MGAPMEALIVKDAHHARSVTPRQNLTPLEQLGQPIAQCQGPPGLRADVTRSGSGRHRHPIGIDPDALPGEGLDVGESYDPTGPAGDRAARAPVAPCCHGQRHPPTDVIQIEGAGGHCAGHHIEAEVSMGTTARRVDRPTRCRAIPTRAPCPVAPLRGHALHMAGRSEVLAPHFSPAVPPGSSTAHRARRRPVAVLAGEPGAWYRHREPLLLARLRVSLETVAHGGLRGSLYHSLRPLRDPRHPPPGPLTPRPTTCRLHPPSLERGLQPHRTLWTIMRPTPVCTDS